ncbi:MAG: LacI family DNA-binding transcriptional regulator [Rhodospirillales bacterium]|nr:LacI family DNA-binding transcriptional regulator [Rhodospirillales bacterium]
MGDERIPGKSGGFITSRDVARRAGVSRSAVSRTFTPGTSVSPRMRERVLKAAEELGYRVNRLAQGLISERSILVGVLVANMSAPYMSRQLEALSRALLQEGMQCLLLNAAAAEDHGISELIDRILEFRVRAIVVMSGAPPSAIVQECLANGVRVILVNKLIDGATTDTILTDDMAGARLAAQRLIDDGCRRPAIISSSAGTLSLTRRTQAAAARFAEDGLTPVIWEKGTTTYETGARAARETLSDAGIDGAFCVTDFLALGYLDAARTEMGRRVPEDLSVVGFDDIPQASWGSYRMTTLRQPVDTLIAAIMRAILRDQADTGAVHEVLPVELVERTTTRK